MSFKLLRTMGVSVLLEYALLRVESDLAQFVLFVSREEVNDVSRIHRHENLLAHGKKVFQAGPHIGDESSAENCSFKEAHRRLIAGHHHVHTVKVVWKS